ncbi:MAG: zinc-finger domain-containing protein [Pseudomonadota bacterium]
MTTTTREIAYVTTTRVHCDGQGGALGHPRIYLQIGAKGFVDCGYCDKRFILKDSPAAPNQ